MSARCASCGKNVPFWIFGMSWCPDCKTLSCRDCRHPSQEFAGPCPVCKGSRIKGSKTAALFVVALLFFPMIGLLSAWDAYTGYVVLDQESLPIVEMEDAHEGDRVKLVGYIVSGGAVAIDGHWDRSGDEPRWVFDQNAITVRNALSDRHFEIDLSQAKIRPGPHRSVRDVDGTCYRDSDDVYIVGKVLKNDNGSGEMAAEALSPDGDFGPWYEFPVWTVVSAISLGIVAALAIRYAYWKWLSDRHVRSNEGMFQTSAIGIYYPEAGHRTIENEMAGKKRKTLIKAASWAGAFSALCLALWANPFISFRDVCWSTVIFAPMAFMLILVFGVAVDWYITPKIFTYDGTGFGFGYGGERKVGMKWAHLSMINFNGASTIKISNNESYIVIIWPKKGFPMTIHNVGRSIAATLEEQDEAMKTAAREDARLSGPDLVGMISELERKAKLESLAKGKDGAEEDIP